jgi:hypothetical protein
LGRPARQAKSPAAGDALNFLFVLTLFGAPKGTFAIGMAGAGHSAGSRRLLSDDAPHFGARAQITLHELAGVVAILAAHS